ncbi:MAG: STAS domain-containing protein [Jannaschia sp.]
MHVSGTTHGDVLVLTLDDDRLDAAGALKFKETVRTAIAKHPGRVALDMENITFLDSSGLGALVGAMKMLGNGRRLELVLCGPIVSKVLTLTRMDKVFVLHDRRPWLADGQDAA